MGGGRRGRVAGLCVLAQAGLAVAPLGWPMIELGCATTHTGAKCAAWGDDAGAPANASCAAYAGEPVGWCWTDEAHTKWQFCDQACRVIGDSPAEQFDMRDSHMFPHLHSAATHLHRRGADIDAAIKVLSTAVANARTDVQKYWETGDATRNPGSMVVESAHSGFLLATLLTVRPAPMTYSTLGVHVTMFLTSCVRRDRIYADTQPPGQGSTEYDTLDALLRGSCPLIQDLYGDSHETNPTGYSSSCYEFWVRSLGDRGDFHTAFDVQRLARDKSFRAEFNVRNENWEAAMNVVKRFAKSRTADRRDGTAFNRFRKLMPAATLGFTEELRLYSLDLLKKASVSDAVEVVQAEVDLVERLYLESGGMEPGGAGKCGTAHTNDQRKAISLADKIAVARMLLRHLPASPQTMSRSAFATRGSEGQAMVAALCVAVIIVGFASCQRHGRKILSRCLRFSSSDALRSQADPRQNSAQGGHNDQSARPDCSDGRQPKNPSSQRQQRRRRKTKAVPTDPSTVPAGSPVVEDTDSKGLVQTPSTAGDQKPGKKSKARHTVHEKPSGTPTAQSRRPMATSARPPQKAATLVAKAAPAQAETVVARDDRVTVAPQPAQPEAEPEQQHEHQARGLEVEQRVPQAQEVNSAISEDLRAIAGRKRQLSQPVSDVSEISSVDGDTASSAGSDAGSVGGQSGSSYGHISPSYGVHHAHPQQNMSWAQKLRSGMATRASDTSDSDSISISSLEDSYSFRSEASCRRRLSTVCSVNNTDGEEAAAEPSPNSQYDDERFGSSSSEGMDAVGRRGRPRSRAMRPTYSVGLSSSDSESDQDLTAGRARIADLRTKRKTAAAIAATASTCHCIDEVWDGRLPEGVMAEKLHAADGGVLGRSAALGTIPVELLHPARHYLGLRQCRSWDAGSASTLSSVMEAEALTAPAHQQDRGADRRGRGSAALPLTRARSVDTRSVGAQTRGSDRTVLLGAPAPVVAPLPFALRTNTRSGDTATAVDAAAITTPVSPPCGPSPTSPPAARSGLATATGQAACSEVTDTNTAEPLISTAAVRRSTSGSRGRAGPAAIAAGLTRKIVDDRMSSPSSSDDAAAPETSGRRQEGSSQQQFVPVPVPVPVHVPMVPCQWPVPQHAMAAEHRLACRHAIEKQILFYFSAENMSRDSFLRSNMDEEGYVSLALIASFRRVAALTNDFSLVMEAVLANPRALELRVGPSTNGSGPAASPDGAEFDDRKQAHSAAAQQPVMRSTDPAIWRLRNELEASK